MARMESQQKHTRDNMRVLATIENDDNYRKLMYNKVIEILSQVDTMSIDLAEQLEAETAVIPTRRENGYIVIPLSPEYDNGLCRHVAQCHDVASVCAFRTCDVDVRCCHVCLLVGDGTARVTALFHTY